MRHRIIARHPGAGIFVMLVVALFADYLCADLRFFHNLAFSSGISAESRWFWPIFGAFIALTLYCVKQLVMPTTLLKADLSGLELGHRVARRPLHVDWANVREITRGLVEFPSQHSRGAMPAIRFVINTPENLGGVISNRTQANDNSVCFAACLFELEIDEVIAVLHQMQADALGR
jgi:hypothetical protein